MKPSSVIAASLAAAFCSANSTEFSAPDLFNRHFAAAGYLSGTNGRAVIAQGYCDSGTRSNGFTLRAELPGMFSLETFHASGERLQILRGEDHKVYAIEGRRRREATEHERSEASLLAIALHTPQQQALQERLAEAVTEIVMCDGRPATATGKRGRRHSFPRFYFDAETGLLSRVGVIRLEDYRQTATAKVPHRLSCLCGSVYYLTNLTVAPGLPAVSFAIGRRTQPWMSSVMPQVKVADATTAALISPPGELRVMRDPAPASHRAHTFKQLPSYDPQSGRHAQLPLQGADVSKMDLTDRSADLLHADFDTRTVWPETLPPGFDPTRVLDLGKDPGLGVREVHARGITGKGIGIGLIDFPLLTSHQEYSARLRLYEEIGIGPMPAHMHGTAVASIAAGDTCGVAPNADLYFIASKNHRFGKQNGLELDWNSIARAIHRLLDVNTNLPPDRRIRVISLSMGWSEGEAGFDQMTGVLRRAREAGVFVISSSLRNTHQLLFDGLSRAALADPNHATSYGPGSWWASMFWSGDMRFKPGKRLCVPMDGRTTASPFGPKDYVHYDAAGWSWSIPWIAGLYALACEADPALTPERFWSEALRTGHTIELQDGSDTIPFGTIANPPRLIEDLQKQSGQRRTVHTVNTSGTGLRN